MLQRVGMAAPSQHLVDGTWWVREGWKTEETIHTSMGVVTGGLERPLQVGALQDGRCPGKERAT